MPTPAERKALMFLAGVIVLGASVRVVRAARDDGSATIATRLALSKQLAAVDSARRDEASGAARAPAARRRAKPRARRADDSRAMHDATPLAICYVDHSRLKRLPYQPPSISTWPTSRTSRRCRESGPCSLVASSMIVPRTVRSDRIDGFQRVRGVGPSLAAALRERVTFSGTARPSNAVVDPRLRSPPASSKSRHRERRP